MGLEMTHFDLCKPPERVPKYVGKSIKKKKSQRKEQGGLLTMNYELQRLALLNLKTMYQQSGS